MLVTQQFIYKYFTRRGVIVLQLLWILVCLNTTAQTTAQQRADKLFSQLRYMQAIDAYESVLKKEPDNRIALKNIATSYRKINDYTNAERCYATLTKADSTDAELHLYYAQSLSWNKKYVQALSAYQKYAALKPDDLRGKTFVQAYSNLSHFYKDSSLMRVQLLNINSGQSDFSPAYYKHGLVFCSNRYEGAVVKHVFGWNQSAFLDLYYVEDTALLKSAQETGISSTTHSIQKQHTNDDDTYTTSNDNATLGYTNYNYKDTGGAFAKPDIAVERFSKKLTSTYHEGPVSFFGSGDSVIFTRNNDDHGKYRKGGDGINKINLFSATCANRDSSWQNIQSLPFNSDDYSTGHPAIAPGDSILYFISDKPGGLGGTDIYKSYYRNGTWSAPVNLGAPVNTSGNEMFPFVSSDNTLYFASNGHPGLGGLDIFKTSLIQPGRIYTLGYPANSNHDDFGFIFNPKTNTGFFSSNRGSRFNDDNLYSIKMFNPFYVQVVDALTKEVLQSSTVSVSNQLSKDSLPATLTNTGTYKVDLQNATLYTITGFANGYAPKTLTILSDIDSPIITVQLYKPQCIISGTVMDKDTKLPVEGARLVIYDITENETVYDVIVSGDGRYRYLVLKPNHQYSINATREGHFNKPPFLLNTDKRTCGTTAQEDYQKDFELEKIVIGRAIKIDNIYFDVGKSTIRPKSAKELDKIVKLMKDNPNIIIELSSHTDCRSSFQYNLTLSDNRAKASASYIISKGVSADRITGKGYGETKLVNNCACEGKVISRKCTEAEHQANRRTEFQVTGFVEKVNDTDE